jgi:signal transduction histidine kinase
MGLRHRSIRLRVGVLITVPVLCLLVLYGFVVSITASNAVSQKHTTTLRDDIANPVADFQEQVAVERSFAILSLANPTNTATASELGVQENKTRYTLAALKAALQSPGVASLAAAPEEAAIKQLLNASRQLTFIENSIADDALTMRAALGDYDAVIDAGYPVIDEALDQLSSVPVATQALDVINLDRASQAASAEWDLLAGDLAQRKFSNADRLTFAALASERQSLINAALPELAPQYRAMLDSKVPPAINSHMGAFEATVIDTPWHRGTPPPQLAGSKMDFIGYSDALGSELIKIGGLLQKTDQHNTDTVITELVLAAGLGLLGIIASIALSLIIGRGLIRQLRELRESALSLAHEKLPNVISRLRAGGQVDPAEYAPSQVSTGNEIEQVQDAFSVVQQTAVQAAVDEARLRRGISDVFRNLAGRSQSLLHRQLTLLDGMERRATEPDELEDLFRIDHLTTRMRRHAEGLIILSGETPARGWRQPVPLIDVLRAAVAEVEDYTRIRVLCRTSAAVAGHAVADVIHLIAELAENATVFSPPNTPVRIQGDIVGRGFAVEIEDRGLGISPARLEEINANLANPPQFDLSGSDRLGLFIAGQLAQRHDIKITLRPSVYGGTSAIVLISTALVVDDQSAERDPALSAARSDVVLEEGFAGRHAVLAQSASSSGTGVALAGPPASGSPGIRVPGNGLPGNGLRGNELLANSADGDESAETELASRGFPDAILARDGKKALDSGNPEHAGSATSNSAAGVDWPWGNGRAGAEADGPEYFARGFSLADRTRQTADADVDVDSSSERPVLAPVSDNAEPAASRTETGEPGLPVRRTEPTVSRAETAEPGLPVRRTEPVASRTEPTVSQAEVAELGLPVRIRQASLAPQLRTSPPAGTAGGPATAEAVAGSGTPETRSVPPEASGADSPVPPTPEAAWNTVSALQRGWQLGRSEAATADDPSVSVFRPRKSPSGQWFDRYDAETGSSDADPADSADEHSGE